MTPSFYKTVYQQKFNELPKWKQLAIVEDSEKNHWSGILTEFIKGVIEEADKSFDEQEKLLKLPKDQQMVSFNSDFDKEFPFFKSKIKSEKN